MLTSSFPVVTITSLSHHHQLGLAVVISTFELWKCGNGKHSLSGCFDSWRMTYILDYIRSRIYWMAGDNSESSTSKCFLPNEKISQPITDCHCHPWLVGNTKIRDANSWHSLSTYCIPGTELSSLQTLLVVILYQVSLRCKINYALYHSSPWKFPKLIISFQCHSNPGKTRQRWGWYHFFFFPDL